MKVNSLTKIFPFFLSLIVLALITFGVRFAYQQIKFNSIRQVIKGNSSRNFFNYLFLIKNDKKEVTTIVLITYYWPKNYVNVFSIPIYIQFKNSRGEYQKIQYFRQKELKQKIESVLQLPIDFSVSMISTKAKRLLNESGGVVIFNEATTNFSKGRLYINGNNVEGYLNSISNQVVKIEIGVSLSINLLLSIFKNYVFFNDSKKIFPLLWSKIQTDLPKGLANTVVKRMIENHETLYIDYGRMNAILVNEVVAKNAPRDIYIPLDEGRFDSQKLKKMTERFDIIDKDLERYPINLQLKNTTSIYRLAARTTGVLRRRRCNVKEYLNSDIDLKRSLIIDRCGSVAKREYLKKITKVNDVYYLVDHREKFDFTLYLGQDYYAIPQINR